MSRIQRFGVLLMLIFLLIISQVSCSFPGQPETRTEVKREEQPLNPSAQSPSHSKAPAALQPITVTLAAVGDVMGHMPELTAAWDPLSKTYDFTPMLANVGSEIARADVAVVNLETTLAGRKSGYSGFPRFNSPDALATALKNTGFDVVTTANNHSMDKGAAGVLRTLSVLDKLKLAHTGTFQSADARQKPLIKDVKGIKMGFLGYTYGTNGLTPPKGQSYLINYAKPESMLQDLKELKQQGAELTVVMLHFGVEYQRQPSLAQEKLVDELIAGGADIILGSHPHVLQPIQMRKVLRDGRPYSGLVAFSLGNFLSNQSQPYTDTGMILEVSLTKPSPDSPVQISGISLIPTWVARYTQGGKTHFEVQPLQALVSGEDKPYLNATKKESLKGVLANTTSHLTSRLHDGSIPVIAPELPQQ